jgi:cellulose synthase/poly-beta-1,6-N-acetylglucosamine synthase-like glycosyltransferase
MKIPLFITSFNRPEYVKQSIDSLYDSNLPNYLELIWSDDGSNKETVSIIEKYKYKKWPCRVIFSFEEHQGMRELKLGQIKKYFSICGDAYPPYFFVSDSDVIYSKNWAQTLIKLMKTNKDIGIISGIDVTTNNHHTLEKINNINIKKSIAGQNFLMKTDLYLKYPFPISHKSAHEWDFRMCDNAQKENLKVCSTNPSIVNHVGKEGLFCKKKLP